MLCLCTLPTAIPVLRACPKRGGSAGRTGRHRHERLPLASSIYCVGMFQNSGTNRKQFRSNRPLTGAAFIHHLNTPRFGGPTLGAYSALFAKVTAAAPNREIGSGCHPCSWRSRPKNDILLLTASNRFPPQVLFRKGDFPLAITDREKRSSDSISRVSFHTNPGDVVFRDMLHSYGESGGDALSILFFGSFATTHQASLYMFHDNLLPFRVPGARLVVDECRFWSEQYLLQAFS